MSSVGYCLALCGLLIAVASLISKHGLWGLRASVVVAPRLYRTGSVAVARRLSCLCGIWGLPELGNRSCVFCIARLIL